MRHILTKYGGSISPAAFLFERKAELVVDCAPSDELLEVALEAGADDVFAATALDADDRGASKRTPDSVVAHLSSRSFSCAP